MRPVHTPVPHRIGVMARLSAILVIAVSFPHRTAEAAACVDADQIQHAVSYFSSPLATAGAGAAVGGVLGFLLGDDFGVTGAIGASIGASIGISNYFDDLMRDQADPEAVSKAVIADLEREGRALDTLTLQLDNMAHCVAPARPTPSPSASTHRSDEAIPADTTQTAQISSVLADVGAINDKITERGTQLDYAADQLIHMDSTTPDTKEKLKNLSASNVFKRSQLFDAHKMLEQAALSFNNR